MDKSKHYIMVNDDGTLWCGKYWSKIGEATRYGLVWGSIQCFVINRISQNNIKLVRVDDRF